MAACFDASEKKVKYVELKSKKSYFGTRLNFNVMFSQTNLVTQHSGTVVTLLQEDPGSQSQPEAFCMEF